MARILIVDDDPATREAIGAVAERSGHSCEGASSVREAMHKARTTPFDLVFLDVQLPDGDGLEVLTRIRESGTTPEVVVLTGYGDPEGAEHAIRGGAWEYLQKPLSLDTVRLQIERALQHREEAARQRLQEEELRHEAIIGESHAMRACLDLVSQAANSDVSVLIIGETGTGKELIASAIHRSSRRAAKNFVVVDCAALPETLVESTLFGHEKGAFTGADKAKDGLIRHAHGGTLFLDEIGELPIQVQRSFLRVLQERTFRAVGGTAEITSDFRLVSASNRNLEAMVRDLTFRQDLLFRIRSLVIPVPSLRERPEDIPVLVSYYVPILCQRQGEALREVSPELLEMLMHYAWPGNVRELIHALEKAIIAAPQESRLFPQHLPVEIRAEVARASVAGKSPRKGHDAASRPATSAALPSLKEYRDRAIEEAEERYLRQLLTHANGDIRGACRLSGLSRSRLYTLLKKYGIRPEHQ